MTARPLVSVIIPTCGRPTLARTLASIRAQVGSADCEIVVVGDTFGHDFQDALAVALMVCAEHDAWYCAHAGTQHMVGQEQRQYGGTIAQGAWLAFQQDDGIMAEGAWPEIQAALADGPPCPRLFRATTRHGGLVWATHDLTEGNVDANCLIVPTDPARLGRWANRYAGDFDMIVETVGLWGGVMRWESAIISRHEG